MMKTGNLATLLYKSGNPDGCTLFKVIPFDSLPSQNGFGLKNHVSKAIVRKNKHKDYKIW